MSYVTSDGYYFKSLNPDLQCGTKRLPKKLTPECDPPMSQVDDDET